MRELTERESWFIERVNRRVFRNNFCDCPLCKSVYENGLVIGDTTQAHYLFDTESDLTAEGSPLRYFDTKSEAIEFEKNNPPKNKNND